MAIDTSSLVNAKIKWAANAELGLDTFELSVPFDLTGRVDIWKVPVCEAYPEGIFVGVTSGQYYEEVRPGCASWEATLLAKVRFSGVPYSSEDMSQNVVEYVAPGLELDESELNPNDYSSMFDQEGE